VCLIEAVAQIPYGAQGVPGLGLADFAWIEQKRVPADRESFDSAQGEAAFRAGIEDVAFIVIPADRV
jgi:hypothetical protein